MNSPEALGASFSAGTSAGGGVSIKPPAGCGILFNGNITHSGNALISGTRYVLMTSIVIDNDDDNDDQEEEHKDGEDV